MTPESMPVSAYETHLSRLFFTPDRVFKILKPVTLPFVDFSETKRRCDAAIEEYERNHAISPDVYLGVSDIEEDGVLADRMIVMRRLPADRELRQLLANGSEPDELIPPVARHVASMHAGLEPLRGDRAAPATLEAISANWEDNFATIQQHLGNVIEPEEFHEVTALARAYLAGRAELFQQRIDDGWVRDGHGDLRAEHIYCTNDGPRLIDCVAFDDRLRVSDSLADVAFLAMDLDRLAGSVAAITLMDAWNEFTNEHHPSSLAHFYVAYRAHVRCKIACIRHVAGQSGAAATAKAYHRLAHQHLELAQVRLVLVGGGAGSGKSTISEAVAQHIGGTWLRTDEIRKDVAGLGHDVHAFEEPEQGIYSAEMNERVQQELVRQTELLLQNGVSVVLDATWRSAASRAELRTIGSQCAARVSELKCDLPLAVAKERIARRMASVYNPSDATPELVDYLAARFDEWPEAIPIDTNRPVDVSVGAACQAVFASGQPKTEGPSIDQQSRRFKIDIATLRNAILVSGGLGGQAPAAPHA